MLLAAWCLATAGNALAAPAVGSLITNQASVAYRYDPNAPAATASTNTVAATVGIASAVQFSKRVSPSAPRQGEVATFDLLAVNTGTGPVTGIPVEIDGVAATRVLMRDTLPRNTTLLNASGSTTVLYHRSGAPLHSYTAQTPASWDGIDAVALALPTLAAGAQLSGQLGVRINANADEGIENIAQMYYLEGGIPLNINSNPIRLNLPPMPPSLRYYTNPTYSAEARIATMGSPLYVEADAASCNASATAVDVLAITLSSALTGDQETYSAIETGINTGKFHIDPSVSIRDGSTYPVVPGNGLLEVRRDDRLTATLSGCEAGQAQATILIDPLGVVFDSRSNQPIAGVTVRLIDVTGAGNSGNAGGPAVVLQADGVTPAPSAVITDGEGRFQFPLVAPSRYRLTLDARGDLRFPSTVAANALPAGRIIHPTGSFGGEFLVDANTGAVTLDVPVDTAATRQLFVQLVPLRDPVELGDVVDYRVAVRNVGGTDLADTNVRLQLPAGFRYEPGSLRIEGISATEPLGGRGPVLTLALGTLAAQATRNFTYRVQVGPGALQGDGISMAEARGGVPLQASNQAYAKVKVGGGVFSDRGFVVGKIYADCNRNRLQDEGEPGVPNVRLYLEDGSFVLSDSAGQYSFQGLAPLTHVLHIDPTTLPERARVALMSNRQMGDANSRFVDLRNGEMQRADFSILGCADDLREQITERRKKLDAGRELAASVRNPLTVAANAVPLPDTRSLPASGLVGDNTLYANDSAAPSSVSAALPSALDTSRTAGTSPSANSMAPTRTAPAGPMLANPSASSSNGTSSVMTLSSAATAGSGSSASGSSPKPQAVPALSSIDLATLDNQPGFISLSNDQVLPAAQTRLLFKAPLNATVHLQVNGTTIGSERLSLRQKLPARQLELYEYVGVALKPGRNHLSLDIQAAGQSATRVNLTVRAPGAPARLLITPVSIFENSDPAAPRALRFQLQDQDGVPIGSRQPLTLEASTGLWRVADSDPREPGVQTFIDEGDATFELGTDGLPGEVRITARSGTVKAELALVVTAADRPPIAVGVIEGILNLRRLNTSALQPTRANDGFDQELRHFAQSGNGRAQAAGRAALFLKGKVRGDALLTLGYDSDKDTQTRLFRDIQPDQFYPVYGDESVKGFDAQSTSRLYVRIDKNRSYALYGDFQTQASNATPRSLGAYNRSLTGLRQHYENDRINANVFASRDNTRQIVDELRANGTSGPYVLSQGSGVINSERVEILTRDRNQNALILKTAPLTRFTDYEIEAFTGRLLLRAPVPSVDEALNPLSIRISYEVEQDGPRFWVAGADVQLKVSERIEVGGNWVKDDNPLAPSRLTSGNLRLQISEQTTLTLESARTDTLALGQGTGRRAELRHDAGALQLTATAARTDTAFDNPSSSIGRGRGEGNVRATYKLSDTLSIVGEALHTADVSTGAARDGAQASVERRFEGNVVVQAGVRQVRDRPGTDQPLAERIDTTSVRMKVSAPVPAHPQATVYGEAEQAIDDADKKMVAIGGDYTLPNRGRIYARHEFISSLTGPYFLNADQSQNTSILGIDMDYMKDGRGFSEYRLRDAFSGRSAEAAVGLRNRWTLQEGIYLNTSFERVHALSGDDRNEATAITGAIDYTRDPLWKGSARLELRTSLPNDSVLNTLALARKLDDNWTVLAKSVVALTLSKDLALGDRRQLRVQTGAAYRDAKRNRWNALARYEYREDRDATSPLAALDHRAHIISMHADYQAAVDLLLNARYAAKQARDRSYGLDSHSVAQLVSVRAVQDLNERWDVGLIASTLFSAGGARQYGLGAEAGYRLAKNLWLALGYNIFGFDDPDLASEETTTQAGLYARIRYKFDETALPRGWLQP